jgi:hypothetical protein
MPGLVSVRMDRADSHRAVHVSGREVLAARGQQDPLHDPVASEAGDQASRPGQPVLRSSLPHRCLEGRREGAADGAPALRERLESVLLATALALLAPFQKHQVSNYARGNGPSPCCRRFAGIISPLSAETEDKAGTDELHSTGRMLAGEEANACQGERPAILSSTRSQRSRILDPPDLGRVHDTSAR